jgi:rod shape determining protein RodA
VSRNQPTISKGIDGSLIWLYFILSAIGITAIFAVTYKDGDPILQSFLGFKTDYSKQLYFFFISIFIGIFILLTDSKFFAATANLLYAFGIFTLLLVFPFIVILRELNLSLNLEPLIFNLRNLQSICLPGIS